MKLTKFFIIFILVFSSCKSSKTAFGTAVVAEKMSAKKVVKNHISTNFNKKTIEAKLNVNYEDGKNNQSVSVKLRIKKDSVIWLNATYAGFLVARAQITPTSVQYYEKLDKTYFEGDFSMLKNMLGTEVSFHQLQNILLGQTILNLEDQNVTATIDNNAHLVSPEDQNVLFDVLYWINPSHFKVDRQVLRNTIKNQILTINYKEYSLIDGVVFPKEISIVGKQNNSFTKIQIDFKSVDFDKDISTPYKVPSGYKQLFFNE